MVIEGSVLPGALLTPFMHSSYGEGNKSLNLGKRAGRSLRTVRIEGRGPQQAERRWGLLPAVTRTPASGPGHSLLGTCRLGILSEFQTLDFG